MRSHIQVYKIRLKTLSPVFIGSGKSVTKKEYIYKQSIQRIIMVNFHKFSGFLTRNNLVKAYEDFVTGNANDLYNWLRSRNIDENDVGMFSGYEIYAGDALVPKNAERSRNGNTRANTDNETAPLKEVFLFIKDNYGKPYIPGSSLKGAIHTAILSKLLADDKNSSKRMVQELIERVDDYKGNPKWMLSKEIRNIEAKLNKLSYNKVDIKDLVNSIMRGIQISDGNPLDCSDLCLCAKIDFRIDRKVNYINTTRECLKPGTETEFALTLDNELLKSSGIDIEYIRKAIHEFAKTQNKSFTSKFEAPVDNTPAEKGLLLYLGGASGFVSKTVNYSMDITAALELNRKILTKSFVNHKHEKDIIVSPHTLKCTKYNGRFFEFGRCQVGI